MKTKWNAHSSHLYTFEINRQNDVFCFMIFDVLFNKQFEKCLIIIGLVDTLKSYFYFIWLLNDFGHPNP